jgi:hypothetical protein
MRTATNDARRSGDRIGVLLQEEMESSLGFRYFWRHFSYEASMPRARRPRKQVELCTEIYFLDSLSTSRS